MLLQGVNLFVGHGWPYTPPGAQEPGYSFYAAAVFNNHQPWWNVMPDVNAYLQRTSYLLRQGEPANDVALLLPNDDVYAESKPGKVSLSAEMHKHVTPAVMEQILDAGHNVDFLDDEALRDSGKLAIDASLVKMVWLLSTVRSTSRHTKLSPSLRISAPGSSPVSVSTWKPLQIPSTGKPLPAPSTTAAMIGDRAAIAPERK